MCTQGMTRMSEEKAKCTENYSGLCIMPSLYHYSVNHPDCSQNFVLKTSILRSVTTDHRLKRKCQFIVT